MLIRTYSRIRSEAKLQDLTLSRESTWRGIFKFLYAHGDMSDRALEGYISITLVLCQVLYGSCERSSVALCSFMTSYTAMSTQDNLHTNSNPFANIINMAQVPPRRAKPGVATAIFRAFQHGTGLSRVYDDLDRQPEEAVRVEVMIFRRLYLCTTNMAHLLGILR